PPPRRDDPPAGACRGGHGLPLGCLLRCRVVALYGVKGSTTMKRERSPLSVKRRRPLGFEVLESRLPGSDSIGVLRGICALSEAGQALAGSFDLPPAAGGTARAASELDTLFANPVSRRLPELGDPLARAVRNAAPASAAPDGSEAQRGPNPEAGWASA